MAQYDQDELYTRTFGGGRRAEAFPPVAPPVPAAAHTPEDDLYARAFGPRAPSTPTPYQALAPAVNSWAAGLPGAEDPARLDKVNASLRSFLGRDAPPPGLLPLKDAEELLRRRQMDHATSSAPYTAKWAVERAGKNLAPYGLPGLAKVEKSYSELLSGFFSRPIVSVPGREGGVLPPAVTRVANDLPWRVLAGTNRLIASVPAALGTPFDLAAQALRPLIGDVGPSELTQLAEKIRQIAEKGVYPIHPDAGNVEKGLLSAGESLGMSTPLLLAAPLAAGVPGAINLFAGGMALGTYGNTYLGNLEKTKDPARAAYHGAMDAGYEYLFERMGGAAVLLDKAQWAKGFIGATAKFIAREVPTEMGAELMQSVDDWLLLTPEKTAEQFLAELPDLAVQTLVATLAGGAGQIALVRAIEAATNALTGSAQAEREQSSLGKLFAAATEAELFQADPAAFNEFMRGISPDQHVRIGAELLSQALVDAGKTVADVPSLAEQGTLPGEIDVPLGELVTALAGTPVENTVIQNIRLDPEAATIAERRELGNKALEEFQATSARALESRRADARFQGAMTALKEELEADLAATGTYKPGATAAFADLAATMHAVTASRLGITPLQLRDGWTDAKGNAHKGYNLLAANEKGPVKREQPKATAKDFAPGRVGNILRRKDWAVITAENPNNIEISPEENAARNEMLRAELLARGLRFKEATGAEMAHEQVEGKYVAEGKEDTAPLEHPFLVLGIDLATAREIAKKFEQDSVLAPLGLVYHDDTVEKAVNVTEHDTEPRNYWTRIPSTGALFTINLDFGNRVPLRDAGDFQGLAQEAAAKADYDKEVAFAKRVITGEAKVEDFEYYDDYVRTVDAEVSLLPEGTKRVLFIGSGPAPLSPILFARKGYEVTGLDISQEAKDLGEKVAALSGTPINVIAGDATAFDFSGYDAVVLALEAGANDSLKTAILRRANATLPEAGLLLLRGSKTPEFVSAREAMAGIFLPVGAVDTWGGLGETVSVRSIGGILSQRTADQLTAEIMTIAEKLKVTKPGQSKVKLNDKLQVLMRQRTLVMDAEYEAARQGTLFQPAPADGITVVGVHFGAQARDELMPAAYGTGILGAEREEVMAATDARRKHRTHFYVNTGVGVFPEAGVGTSAHVVMLPNMYDATVDPLGLFRDARTAAGRAAAETAVLDAGFDGYVSREFGRQGAAVVFRPERIKTEFVGTLEEALAQAEVIPPPKWSALQKLKITLMAARNLPAYGPADMWDRAIGKLYPEEHAILKEQGVFDRVQGSVYKDELLKLLSPIGDELYQGAPRLAPNGKPSNLDARQWAHVRTPEFKAWFGDWEKHALAENPVGSLWSDPDVSKIVDENGEPRVVYHGAEKGGFGVFAPHKADKHRSSMVFAAGTRTTAASYSGRSSDVEVVEPEVREEDGQFVVYTDDDTRDGVFDTREEAEDYAYGLHQEPTDDRGVYPIFLNIRNPLEEDFEGGNWDGSAEGWYEVLDENGDKVYSDEGAGLFTEGDARALAQEKSGIADRFRAITAEMADAPQERYAELHAERVALFDDLGGYEVVESAGLGRDTNSVAEEAKKYGHDGAYMHDVVDDGGRGSYVEADDVFVFFDANQAKSATLNTGAYSRSDDSILRQKVWHGTPNTWAPEPGFPHGRPRLDLVGASQGGSAYGWGWYSAEDMEVARSYRSGEDASLYQLEVPDEVTPFVLDWGRPLREQSPGVRAALASSKTPLPVDPKRAEWKDATGATLYWALSRDRGGDKAASEFLGSLGIVGLRYQERARVKAGKTDFNYVIWDQATLDKTALLERNGEKLGALRELYQTAFYSPLLRARVAELGGLPRFQGRQDARGTFNPETLEYTMLAKANLSTFAHELGHFFTAVHMDLALELETRAANGEALSEGEQGLLDDMNAVLEWMGENMPAAAEGSDLLGQQAAADRVARARAQGFDVEDPLYHWSSTGDFKQFRPYQHFGTEAAAMDRYVNPADGTKSVGELQARAQEGGLPPEGATFKVWINKSKVLKLPSDSGQHDAFNLAWSVGKAGRDKAGKYLLDEVIRRAVLRMTDAQVEAWAMAEEYSYLLSEAEGMSLDGMRELILVEHLDRQGPYRLTDGAVAYFNSLVANTDQEAALADVTEYLNKKGVTALSYKNEVEDPGSISYVVPDPKNVRSTLAAFEGDGAQDLLSQGLPPAQPAPPRRLTLATWARMSLAEQAPYHEKFAETWEQYLFTGKAPTKKLESLFRRLSDWMRRVYLSMKNFLAQRKLADINPEISAVMDRMVATKQEIAAAQERRGQEALFKDAVAAGMTPEQYAKYLTLSDEAKAEAEEQLRARALRDMKWVQNRRNKTIAALQKEAAEKRKEVRALVTAEAAEEPVFRAQKWLRHGIIASATGEEIQALKGHKLHIPALEAMFPAGAIEGAPDWRKLGYGKYGMLSAEGVHPDLVAEMFGYRSGSALVDALLNAPNFKEEVEGRTDQRMLEKYGDLATPEGISRAADEAIMNDVRLKVLATELSYLNKAMGSPAAVTRAAKAYAAALIESRVVKNLKPGGYAADAARAGKAALKALGKGETDVAAEQKRLEVLHHAAAREAYAADKEAKKIVDRLSKIARVKNDDSAAKSRNMDAVNAVRVVLSSFGFGTVVQGETARAYLDALKQQEPDIAATMEDLVLTATAHSKHWRNLRVIELRELNELVESVWSVARRAKEMEIDGKRISRQAVVDELLAAIDKHEPDTGKANLGVKHAVTPEEQRELMFSTLKALFRRVSDWAEAVDGGRTLGPFRKYVWFPIKDAADQYRVAKVSTLKTYRELLKPLAGDFGGAQIDAREIDYVFGKGDVPAMSELLHALLHTGNTSNKRKLLLGRGWATENEDGTLDTTKWDKFIGRMQTSGVLNKDHYTFIQGVWDMLEGTKGAAQKAHRAVFGRSFDEVTANAFATPWGTYVGGYVPAMVDSRIESDAALRELANTENESLVNAFPTPAKGFTMSRVEYNRKLLLDLRSLAGHIDKVLLFSHLAEPVADVRRVLMSPELSKEINRIDPAAIASMFTPWLNRAAKQVVEVKKPGAGSLGRFWSVARSRAGMAAMFANVVNTVQQFTGVFTAAVKVKPVFLLEANAQYLAHPKDTFTFVTENSAYMKEHLTQGTASMSGDVTDILVNPSKYESVKAWSTKHAYFMQTAIDQVMGPIIWVGAYKQAVDLGETHEAARKLADDVVRQTQGSQLPEEIANYEVGSPFYRMFTQFSGFFNAQANMLGTEFSKVSHELGLREGLGRGFFIFVLGVLSPAMVSELIVQAFRGGPDDEDKDGEYLDDWAAALGFGTARYVTAMAPGVGPTMIATWNTFNHKPYDDRMSTAPAISMIETAVKAPASVYRAAAGDGKPSRAIMDSATLVSMTLGVPARSLAKPLAYAADVEDDRIAPVNALDYARGLLTGTASPESKQ